MVFQLNFFDKPRNSKEKQIIIDVLGIVNGPVIETKFNTGTRRQRIPLIMPNYQQCIVELWTPKYSKMAKFDKNWRSLQLVLITGLIYSDNINYRGETIKILRFPKFKAKNRFIWLSGPNFWNFPVLYGPTIPYNEISANWPDPPPLKTEGFLNTSKGSIKTAYWAKLYPKLHTNTLEPYDFKDLVRFHLDVEKSVCGFINLYTLKRTDDSLCFEK